MWLMDKAGKSHLYWQYYRWIADVLCQSGCWSPYCQFLWVLVNCVEDALARAPHCGDFNPKDLS